MAVKNVSRHFAGTIATPAEYEDHILTMASAVWRNVKVSDNRERRSRQDFRQMDFTIQEARAAADHRKAIDNGATCTDRHQGIARSSPAGHLVERQRILEKIEGQQPAK